MTKQVREKVSASVTVIMKGNRHVANIHTLHGGRTQVDVFCGDDKALKANCKAMGIASPDDDVCGDWKDAQFQTSSASGGGYDKATAALSGMHIDGYRMFDHCGRDESLDRLLARYKKDMVNESNREDGDPIAIQRKYDRLARKRGARFANQSKVEVGTSRVLRMLPAYVCKGVPIETPREDRVWAEPVGDGWQYVADHGDLNVFNLAFSLFYQPGTDRLREMGYTVINAL